MPIPPLSTVAAAAGLPPEASAAPSVAPVINVESGQTSSDLDSQRDANRALEEAMHTLNQGLQAWSTKLRFELDDDAGRVVIQVIDTETGDVVRQIPSDEALRLSKSLGELKDLAFRAQA